MTTVNLFSQLGGTPDNTGQWIIQSGPANLVGETTTATNFNWTVGNTVPGGNTPTLDFNGADAGTYVVDYVLAGGTACQATSTLTITVRETPVVTVTTNDTDVCQINGSLSPSIVTVAGNITRKSDGGVWSGANGALDIDVLNGALTVASGASLPINFTPTSSANAETNVTYDIRTRRIDDTNCATTDQLTVRVSPNLVTGTCSNTSVCAGDATPVDLTSLLSGNTAAGAFGGGTVALTYQVSSVSTGATTIPVTDGGAPILVGGGYQVGSVFDALDLSGFPAGTTITWNHRLQYTFSGDATPSCTSIAAGCTITIDNAPNAGTGGAVSVCN